jgi:hypothetical protein
MSSSTPTKRGASKRVVKKPLRLDDEQEKEDKEEKERHEEMKSAKVAVQGSPVPPPSRPAAHFDLSLHLSQPSQSSSLANLFSPLSVSSSSSSSLFAALSPSNAPSFRESSSSPRPPNPGLSAAELTALSQPGRDPLPPLPDLNDYAMNGYALDDERVREEDPEEEKSTPKRKRGGEREKGGKRRKCSDEDVVPGPKPRLLTNEATRAMIEWKWGPDNAALWSQSNPIVLAKAWVKQIDEMNKSYNLEEEVDKQQLYSILHKLEKKYRERKTREMMSGAGANRRWEWHELMDQYLGESHNVLRQVDSSAGVPDFPQRSNSNASNTSSSTTIEAKKKQQTLAATIAAATAASTAAAREVVKENQRFLHALLQTISPSIPSFQQLQQNIQQSMEHDEGFRGSRGEGEGREGREGGVKGG